MRLRCALGFHRWREVYRESFPVLWQEVSYRCLDCGVPRGRHERPWDGDRSLDPDVRYRQAAEDRQRAAELRGEG